MRQFLLGANAAYLGADSKLTAAAAGSIAFGYLKDNEICVDNDGTKIKDKGYIFLARGSAEGGPIVLPIYKNNFSFVKGEYFASTTFTGKIVVASASPNTDYTIIIVKKGVQFNERNKWTVTVRAKATDTKDTVAKALAAAINANSASSGVTATDATGTITVTAVEKGVGYTLVGADGLMGVAPTGVTEGLPAYGDAEYVKKLAMMAAADAGFEYTYMDDIHYLYPKFPLDPLAGKPVADAGYTIFTLRFAEPREVKTRDEVVNQIIQVAFPARSAVITTFETVCSKLAE